MDDTTLRLIAAYQADPSPRNGDRLLRQFERWCHGQAHRNARRFGLDYDMALQAARMAIVDAAERFEPERGLNILTFAAHKVRRRVAEARAEAFGSTSTSILETRRKIGHAVEELIAEGRSASDDAVARHLGWGTARVTAARRRELSLDAPLTDAGEGGDTLHDVLAAPESTRTDRLAERRMESEELRVALQCAIATSLTDRRAEIMRAFIAEGCEVGAMGAIADRLGVTKQMVSATIGLSMPQLRRALELNGWNARRMRGLG